MGFVLLLLFLPLSSVVAQRSQSDKNSIELLVKISADLIHDTDERMDQLELIRVNSRNSIGYEVGYLVKVMQEMYRKQVDKYNVSKMMFRNLNAWELLLYLEEIEHHYWEIEHVSGMIHEVERKYGQNNAATGADLNMSDPLKKIFSELSWNSRLRLLDKYYPNPHPRNWSSHDLMFPGSSINFQPRSLRNRRMERRVRVEAFRQNESPDRRTPPPSEPPETLEHLEPTQAHSTVEDERKMKLKLFRLMYESVRDSDLKVKRAELIKSHYANSSAFDTGYLLGDVNDKFNIMTDIAVTLKRLYIEWKPIEHINAYEQIANQAIEINHLVDIVKAVSKRNA